MSISSDIQVPCLLVDDLEANLLALEALLEHDGLLILKARSGTEALELLLKHDVALAFIDVQMPEMDGFELAELMRGSDRTRAVPIIFLTAGNADPRRRFRGYEAGAVDYLQKPLEPAILRGKASVFFELYRQRERLRAATLENARLLAESRRDSAALEEEARRKDEFVAMLAHELRNPLAAISNAAYVSRLSPGTQNSEWALSVIEAQVKNLSRLIDDLLDVSRIMRGVIQLRRQPIDVRIPIANAVAAVAQLIESHQHTLTVELNHGDSIINADPTRIEQVVVNLLNNAAKYSNPRSRITLTSSSENDELVIRVADTGLGIAPEKLASIFDLFYQADRSPLHSEGGLGIGLTIVRGIVDLYGGTVIAESPGKGQGSTFQVRLPIVPAGSVELAAECDLCAGGTRFESLRVLVVDDNRQTASGLEHILRHFGHDVRVSDSGEDALVLVQSFRPECLLLDIGLPGMSGHELARTLKRQPDLQNALFIAISGFCQESDKMRSKAAGFHHHLVKPVNHIQLLNLMARRKDVSTPAGE